MNIHLKKEHPKAEIYSFISAGIWFSLIMMVLLSGCSTTGSVLDNTEQLRREAVEIYIRLSDRLLEDSEYGLCQGASKGSLDRRYGNSIEASEAYNNFCSVVKSGVLSIGVKNGN